MPTRTGDSQTPAPSRMHESCHRKKKIQPEAFSPPLVTPPPAAASFATAQRKPRTGKKKQNKLTAPFLILTSRPGASHPPPPPAPALQSQLVRAARLARALCASAIATATASASAPAPIKCQGTSRRVLLGLLSAARSPSIPVRYETLYGVPNPSPASFHHAA